MLSHSTDPLELTFDPIIEAVVAAARAELAAIDTVRDALTHAPPPAPKEEPILDGVTIIANCLGHIFRV